jgi:hypothetical protein
MKKLLFIALLSTIVVAAQAQFGLKGGLNISTATGSDATDSKSKAGFYFGVFYNIPIGNSVSLQTEAVYSAEGAKFDDAGDELKFLLNYINLSALFRYNFQGGFFLGTGPQLGIRTSAKAKELGVTVDIKDQIKSTDFAWAFATGYDLPMGLGFYARYNLGLAKIAEDGSDIKTSCFQLGLRYTFKMAGKKK